jgi:hypothetical protein
MQMFRLFRKKSSVALLRDRVAHRLLDRSIAVLADIVRILT